jgi:hypothetical protein
MGNICSILSILPNNIGNEFACRLYEFLEKDYDSRMEFVAKQRIFSEHLNSQGRGINWGHRNSVHMTHFVSPSSDVDPKTTYGFLRGLIKDSNEFFINKVDTLEAWFLESFNLLFDENLKRGGIYKQRRR